MKKAAGLFLVLLLTTSLIGCNTNIGKGKAGIEGEDRSEISVRVNDEDIYYILTPRPFTSKDDFRKAYMEIDREELIYAPKGSKVMLNLNGKDGEINVKAYWINKGGAPNYNDSFGAPLSMDIKTERVGDSEYEYTVERLFQAGLSSYYEENEKITAGYVVELHNNDEIQYCFFIVQIDKN